MPTLRDAAELLASAQSMAELRAIAAAVGCTRDATPLDRDTRRALGLIDRVLDAEVAPGCGALRALLVIADADTPLRELVQRIASRLSARTPHVLWLLVAAQPSSGEVAVAAWLNDRRPPRIAAMLAQRTRIVDSDAETLRALACAASDRDVVTHTRWIEVLGREALTVRFYRALERAVAGLALSSTAGSEDARREVALLDTSRLLFLSFLEAKGWLDGDAAFLAHQFDACMASGGRFHDRLLRPLFFGTLNTPLRRRAPAARALGRIPFLNGGLFAPTATERRFRGMSFSDEAYGALIDSVFAQYRFTAREETATWTEAAVDPEMLGRAFESLMAAAERRRTGAFFTPFALVERVANAGLESALGDAVNPGDAPSAGDPESALRDGASHHMRIERLTVLDPACGSGAFLVHILERLASLLVRHGDTRDVGVIRREVLTRSIFGVDVNPMAVWLCELRLWLSVVIESDERDPTAVVPLPNLDRNIRLGDALSGRAFGAAEISSPKAGTLSRLRERYARATGVRKDTLARALEREERSRALTVLDEELSLLAARRRDLVAAHRGRDLFGERHRASPEERAVAVAMRRQASAARALRRRIARGGALPFSFSTHFADVAARGGFGLVVGNPPWVRLHRIPVADRIEFRREYEVARAATWDAGAAIAGAGRGFAAQVDAAALFAERAVRLLAPGASLALLVPVKLWRSLAGGGVRALLMAQTCIALVEDHSEAAAAFDAAVYPSLVVGRRKLAGDCDASAVDRDVRVVVHDRLRGGFGWRVAASELPFDATAGAPWLFLPPDARCAFDRVRAAGIPLAESVIGRPHLGVKCGCNDAFILDVRAMDDELAEAEASDGTRVLIERALLRPLVRGDHLRRWCIPSSTQHIVWTHGDGGEVIARVPPLAAGWLERWRSLLRARSDARHRARWWSLFRIEGARADRPRVVWGDVGREPRASVLEVGDMRVPLNSCYVTRCRDLVDAHALATLLNSPLARAWLNALAEPARGGYRRYLGWTLSLLPVPTNWPRARAMLAPIGEAARCGTTPSEAELLSVVLDAFDLDMEGIAPLVAWCAQ